MIQVPKLRPARPHSSSEPMPAAGLRHRAAQNPAKVTRRKKKQKISSAVVCNRSPGSEICWLGLHPIAEGQRGDGLAVAGLAPLVDDDAEVAEGLDDRLHVASNLGTCAYGDFVGLFDGYDAAVGPRALRDGVESGGEFAEPYVQVLPPCAQGPQHGSLSQSGGVCVCGDDVQRDHAALDGQVGVLPGGEAFYGHVAGLRGRRDELELLTGGLDLLLLGCLGRCRAGRRGAGTAAGEQGQKKGREGKDGCSLEDESGATHDYQHTKMAGTQKGPITAKSSEKRCLRGAFFLFELHLPVQIGGRFSRKACVPSVLSSVPQRRPKIFASTSNAASRSRSLPRSTASRHPATARGAMVAMARASSRPRSSRSGCGNDFVDEADAQGLGCCDHLSGEQELEGCWLAYEPRETLRASVAWNQAELDLGLAQARGFAGYAEGAGHGQFAAPAEGEAVDEGDDWFAAGLDEPEDGLAAAGFGCSGCGVGCGDLVDVGTGCEGLFAGAGQQDYPDVCVFGEARKSSPTRRRPGS